MNCKEIYNIVTKKNPYNPNRSYYQNQNRNVTIFTVKGEENLKEKLEALKNQGYKLIRVFDGTGKTTVNF